MDSRRTEGDGRNDGRLEGMERVVYKGVGRRDWEQGREF